MQRTTVTCIRLRQLSSTGTPAPRTFRSDAPASSRKSTTSCSSDSLTTGAQARTGRKFPLILPLPRRFGAGGARAIADFIRNRPAKRGIVALYASACEIGEAGAIALSEVAAKLARLGLNYNSIGDAGALVLMRPLADSACLLTVVGLTGNGLTDAAAVGIAEALQAAGASSRLQRIFLNENRIGDKGGIALAAALTASTVLQRLGLSQNHIGCPGGASLLDAAANSPSCDRVCLFGNPMLEDAAFCAKAATMPNINTKSHG